MTIGSPCIVLENDGDGFWFFAYEATIVNITECGRHVKLHRCWYRRDRWVPTHGLDIRVRAVVKPF